MNTLEERLERAFRECEKHKKRLKEALADMSVFMPLNTNSYINLTKDDVRIIDQFLFRLSKLQDVLGDKLFRLVLSFAEEDVFKLTFIDILNRLERYGIIENVQQWRELRALRNELSHEYEDEPQMAVDGINKAYDKAEELFKIFEKVKEFYERSKEKV